jgi:hypothetical protein
MIKATHRSREQKVRVAAWRADGKTPAPEWVRQNFAFKGEEAVHVTAGYKVSLGDWIVRMARSLCVLTNEEFGKVFEAN